jgi:integrase/recombinase XerD
VARAAKPGPKNRTTSHWLGRTDDFDVADDEALLSYEQAVAKAWAWFKTLKTGVVCDARPVGRNDQMIYSPVGNIFTVGHAIRDYVEWKRISFTHSWFLANLSIANSYVLPQLGTIPVDELTAETIQKFLKYVIETPAMQSLRGKGKRLVMEKMDDETLRKRKDRANEVLGCLRGALILAWESGKTENERCWRPLKYLRNPPQPRTLHLNRAECKELIDECPADLALLVQGALYSGCRSCELIRMRVEDVGHDGYGVHVVPGKGYRHRFVFLPDEGMAFFLSLAKGKRPKDSLFLRNDGSVWRQRYRKAFKQAVNAAGLPAEFTFHGLRHTYASQLVQAGAPLIAIAEQLGQRNINSVSLVYGHLAPQVREAEIRQRFTSLSRRNSRHALKQKTELKKLHKSLQRADWRGYAIISI